MARRGHKRHGKRRGGGSRYRTITTPQGDTSLMDKIKNFFGINAPSEEIRVAYGTEISERFERYRTEYSEMIRPKNTLDLEVARVYKRKITLEE